MYGLRFKVVYAPLDDNAYLWQDKKTKLYQLEKVYPTISIITVCYNAAHTIERTLRSVASQTYQDIEYIIVDGASTDETLDLVRSLAPKAHVYSEPDKGIYDAMNKGLRLATGHYVWFLNAGDALPGERTVEAMVREAFSDNDETYPDIIYGDTRLIDGEDRDLGLRRLRPPKDLSWKSFIDGMKVCHQSFVARRDLCPEYDLNYRFSADVDWCIRVMKASHRYVRIDRPLSLYLHEGATTANARASLLERFRVMCKHYGLLSTLWAHVRFVFVRHR